MKELNSITACLDEILEIKDSDTPDVGQKLFDIESVVHVAIGRITSDLVSFGNYLLSADREALYKNHPENDHLPDWKERMKQVSDADISNWKDMINSKSPSL